MEAKFKLIKLSFFILTFGLFSCSQDSNEEFAEPIDHVSVLSFSSLEEFNSEVVRVSALSVGEFIKWKDSIKMESMSDLHEKVILEFDKVETKEQYEKFIQKYSSKFLFNSEDPTDFYIYLKCKTEYAPLLNEKGEVMIDGQIFNFNEFNKFSEYSAYINDRYDLIIEKEVQSPISRMTELYWENGINYCKAGGHYYKYEVSCTPSGDQYVLLVKVRERKTILGISTGWGGYKTTFYSGVMFWDQFAGQSKVVNGEGVVIWGHGPGSNSYECWTTECPHAYITCRK